MTASPEDRFRNRVLPCRYLRKVAAQADWYCAKLSRDHVEKYVGQSGVGGYLVRQSEKNPDDFVLVVKSKEAVLSFKIKRSDVGFTIRGDTYNSMESVIRHVTRNPLQNADGGATLKRALAHES